MNQHIKGLWVEALRSGRYKRARNLLRIDNSYCPLGVLCDLAAQRGVGHWESDGQLWYFRDEGTDVHNASQLTPGVCSWAWIRNRNPFIQGRQISSWNDAPDSIGFKTMADMIENSGL